MFTHTVLGTNHIEKSRAFYTAVMGALGHQAVPLPHGTLFPSPNGALMITKPRDGNPATWSNGFTQGFVAKTFDEVDAFHAAGLANGGTCEGPPGVRENAPGKQYGAYLRDPDGNKICAFAPNPNA